MELVRGLMKDAQLMGMSEKMKIDVVIDILQENEKIEEATEFTEEVSRNLIQKKGYRSELTWNARSKMVDLLVKQRKLGEALSLAQEHSLKMEAEVGYKHYETWKSKEKLIGLLLKLKKVKEALSAA